MSTNLTYKIRNTVDSETICDVIFPKKYIRFLLSMNIVKILNKEDITLYLHSTFELQIKIIITKVKIRNIFHLNGQYLAYMKMA